VVGVSFPIPLNTSISSTDDRTQLYQDILPSLLLHPPFFTEVIVVEFVVTWFFSFLWVVIFRNVFFAFFLFFRFFGYVLFVPFSDINILGFDILSPPQDRHRQAGIYAYTIVYVLSTSTCLTPFNSPTLAPLCHYIYTGAH